MRLPSDLTGVQFGRLTAQSRVKVDARGNSWWLCHCECGETRDVPRYNLVTGNTRSCGCLARDTIIALDKGRTKHGHSIKTWKPRTPTYTTWVQMRQRCLNPSAENYEGYGGRGITVCDRWSRYENFLADMGDRPEGKTIDRINNEGNYEPSNCRWATPKEQSANRRRSVQR